MSVVSLVGVHKSYGTWPVLQGVDLMVPDGARIGITMGGATGVIWYAAPLNAFVSVFDSIIIGVMPSLQ